MSTVRCSAEFRQSDGDQQLRADLAFAEWVRRLPAGAVLAPISIDKGNQRDPWPVLVGLRATWEEER